MTHPTSQNQTHEATPTSNKKLFLAFLSLCLAYALLLPGITQPVLHMTTTLDKAELTELGKEAILNSDRIPPFLKPTTASLLAEIEVTGKVVIQDTAKSILGNAETLWQEGNRLVASLILLFSVVIPAFKLLLLASATLLKRTAWSKSGIKISGFLTKWSMADVFVMALIVSFLAIKASSGTSALIETQVTFEAGFYYFLGYCIFSIISSQLWTKPS